MYQRALDLLEKKIQTIPLNNKRPTLSFKYVKEITADFIENEAQRYTNATGLGALCRGLWCIDIDNNGNKSGITSLQDTPYFDELDHDNDTTLIQATPSGGAHMVFKKREGINYRQKIGYLPLVDIKAHDNNYFVLYGSVINGNEYKSNGLEPQFYQGDFEKRIFGSQGSYADQENDKYLIRNVLSDYDFTPLHPHNSKGKGKGQQAYERITNGTSNFRNDDLFKAVSYALTCAIPISPLRAVIGTVNSEGDLFTEEEFNKTVESARNSNRR